MPRTRKTKAGGKGRGTLRSSVVDHTYRDFSRVAAEELVAGHPGARGETFPLKLHAILSSGEHAGALAWLPHGRAWAIVDRGAVAALLSQYFDATAFASFNRSVNGWGFKRLWADGPDRGAYYHELFLRGLPDHAAAMTRLKLPGKRLPNPSGEPNFYEISRKYPLPEKSTPPLSLAALLPARAPVGSPTARGSDNHYSQSPDATVPRPSPQPSRYLNPPPSATSDGQALPIDVHHHESQLPCIHPQQHVATASVGFPNEQHHHQAPSMPAIIHSPPNPDKFPLHLPSNGNHLVLPLSGNATAYTEANPVDDRKPAAIEYAVGTARPPQFLESFTSTPTMPIAWQHNTDNPPESDPAPVYQAHLPHPPFSQHPQYSQPASHSQNVSNYAHQHPAHEPSHYPQQQAPTPLMHSQNVAQTAGSQNIPYAYPDPQSPTFAHSSQWHPPS